MRYYGKICERHPELNGLRSNGNCPGCTRDRWRANRVRYRKSKGERHRERVMAWRAANRDHYLSIASARNATRRARKRSATVDEDAQRAWARLRRRAKRLGLVVDHIVPLAPCRVCGTQGAHASHNFQLLTPTENTRKGNRCMDCFRAQNTPSARSPNR